MTTRTRSPSAASSLSTISSPFPWSTWNTASRPFITVDDIVDIVHEEATEDIHKFGGMEALDEPYLTIASGRMVRKRAGWLAALFLGEMLTATAMAYFEDEIARAVVLALPRRPSSPRWST